MTWREELDVLGACVEAFERMDFEARLRALAYLYDRYSKRPINPAASRASEGKGG